MRPRGKESTKVWITQKMGKERETSYRKMKRSPEERHTNTLKLISDISTITDVFLDQKRVNVCEDTIRTAPREFRKSTTRMGAREEDWRSGGDGGKNLMGII